MAVQDLTTWDETDANGDLTVTSSSLSSTQVSNNGTFYVSKSYAGSPYGNNWEIRFELTVTNAVEATVLQNYFIYMEDSSSNYLNLGLNISSDYTIQLDFNGGEGYDESSELSFGTKYYISIKAVSDTVTVYIRTGSHSGSLVDSIQVDNSANSYDFNLVTVDYAFSIGVSTLSSTIENYDDNYSVAITGTGQYINVDDSFKEMTELYVNVDDNLRKINEGYINVDDSFRKLF